MELPRFYPILDTDTLARCGCPILEAAEGLLEAGAQILQFRHKAHYSRANFNDAQEIAKLCRAAKAQFVVNDRADIAVLLDAALHLGQDDLQPADARRIIGEARKLGYSTHNETQLRAAQQEPADYLAIGPIFPTKSKQKADPTLGTAELRRLCKLTAKPVVAIGGITEENAKEIYNAGATSIAIIGALFTIPCNKISIRERAKQWRVASGECRVTERTQ